MFQCLASQGVLTWIFGMVLVPVTEDPDWHVRFCLGNALPYKVGCDLSVCWTTALDSMLGHLFYPGLAALSMGRRRAGDVPAPALPRARPLSGVSTSVDLLRRMWRM